MENERLLRKASHQRNRNKIELNVEMTDEMKRQEQSVNFGATPYSSSKTASVQNSLPVTKYPSSNIESNNLQQQIGIGTAPNALQRQREFIEFKK